MPSELRTGASLAGFRLESVVGRGATGVVYRAHDATNDRLVALKVLDAELAADERFRHRFLRESRLAARLDHPHIVPILGSGEEDGHLYLAMEYIEGPDLRELLRREGPVEPARALDLVGQVAGALDAAHDAGLVHRDVKPANILVAGTATGELAYVCDFGLARHVSSVSSLTTERGFVGTIDYIPPEQIEGGTVDRRTDVYSLGCVLFECLAGARPFDRESDLSVVFAHLNEPPPRITDLRPELPEAFDAVFATALAKSPGERYSSCGELVAAAEAALEGKVFGRRKPRRRWLAAGLVVLVAAGAAGGALFATRGPHAAPATILPTSIAGAKLGLSDFEYQRIWGNGWRKAALESPPGYSMLTNGTRQVAAYFVGTTDKAVELTTWSKNDRTEAGVGPCSTVAQLKAAYGNELKPVKNNVHDGKVYGYTVGKNMFFGIDLDLTHVGSVALFSNPVAAASFNALNDGPCLRGGAQKPATTVTTPAAALDKPVTYTSREFMPGMAVTVPTGRWHDYIDTVDDFTITSPAGPIPAGTQINFWLDPIASGEGGPDHPAGVPLAGVGRTPAALIAWLRHNPALVVSAPTARRIAGGRIKATSVDLDLSVTAPREDPICPGPCLSYLAHRGGTHDFAFGTGLGEPVRLYFATTRSGNAVHTLAILIDSPSATAFKAVIPAAERILASVRLPANVSPG